jgi:hypothetical protein
MTKTFGELKIGDIIWYVETSKNKGIPILKELKTGCKLRCKDISKITLGYKDHDKNIGFTINVPKDDSEYRPNSWILYISTDKEKAIREQKECAKTMISDLLGEIEKLQGKLDKLFDIVDNG